MIKRLVLLWLIGVALFLTGCGEKNSEYLPPQSEAKSLPESPSPEIDRKIKATLDNALVKNAAAQILSAKMAEEYPLLAATFDDKIILLPKTKIWLYYEGFSSGGIWDKPGAKAFGGNRVSTVEFSNGPVPATLVAHKALEGDRNYFYVRLANGTQGWVGRPYVSKDKAGQEFFMPNSLTGEQVRTSLHLSAKDISKMIELMPERYIPSYEHIDWSPDIPEVYRRQGYEMYRSAVKDGYDKVDAIVNQYLNAKD